MFETSLWIEFEGNGDAFSICSERKRVKFVGWKLEVGEQKKQGNPMVEIALLKIK